MRLLHGHSQTNTWGPICTTKVSYPCCIDVACIEISEDNCVVIQGTYFGDGNTCASTDCIPKLYIDYPEGHPSLIDPYGGTSVAINITAGTTEPAPDSGNLHWKDSTTDWEEVPLVEATDSNYEYQYFDTVEGDVVESPTNAPENTCIWQRVVPSGNGDFCEPATAVGGSGMCYLTGTVDYNIYWRGTK